MLSLVAAIQFLTSIPINMQIPYESKRLAKSTIFFPFVGMIVGFVLALVAFITDFILPTYLSAALVVLSWLWITGALHMDGLLDTADGLLSRRERTQALEIMKDSRIGAMGAIVAVIYLILKILLVFALFDEFQGWFPFVMLCMVPILSRWLMVVAIAFFPYARKDQGLGSWYSQTNRKHVLGSTLVMIVCTSLIATLFYSFNHVIWLLFLVLISVALVICFWFSAYCTRRLGGMTGDTYGALNEITEVILLLTMIFAGGLI